MFLIKLITYKLLLNTNHKCEHLYITELIVNSDEE